MSCPLWALKPFFPGMSPETRPIFHPKANRHPCQILKKAWYVRCCAEQTVVPALTGMHTLKHPHLGNRGETYLLVVLIKEGRWLQEDKTRPPGTRSMMSLRFIAMCQWKSTDSANPVFLNHSMEGADCLREQQSLTQHPVCLRGQLCS